MQHIRLTPQVAGEMADEIIRILDEYGHSGLKEITIIAGDDTGEPLDECEVKAKTHEIHATIGGRNEEKFV